MVNYMYNHYRTITLHDLASEFHYNTSYLSRMFQEQAGRSFSETVKDFKLRKAVELLKTKNWKLDQICDTLLLLRILFRDPVLIENIQLGADHSPVLTPAVPFFRDILHGKIEHLEQAIIRWKNSL